MVQQAREMMHRERKTLWNVKQLLTQLRGDEIWVPCGNLTSEIDSVIFDTESVYNEIVRTRLHTDSTETLGRRFPNGTGSPTAFIQRGSTSGVGALPIEAITNGVPRDADTKSDAIAETENKVDSLDSTKILLDASEKIPEDQAGHSISTRQHANAKVAQEISSSADQVMSNPTEKGDVSMSATPVLQSDHDAAILAKIHAKQDDPNIGDPPQEPVADQDQVEPGPVSAIVESIGEIENAPLERDFTLDAEVKDQGSRGGEDEDDALQPPPRRMTTRAQALATSENNTNSSHTRSASPASWVPPVIHPLYLMPPSAHPDRNFSLPPSEAEDIRRMVMLYVQKQEEVCRGAEKLYVGLLRADRMRKTVFKWCKAEAHVGEMSDGEDWYDKEEWGLDEDLRKGHDDEEDDAVTQGKKTRGRRA